MFYNLDSAKAVGHDGIPIRFVKRVSEYIYRPLSFLYNTSIVYGTFPYEMKIAKVMPLFKGGKRELVSNYRPISLLSTFSKIFEKLVCSALTAISNM